VHGGFGDAASGPFLTWGDWIESVTSPGEDKAEYYRKLGEAYQIPPWRIPYELSAAQAMGLFQGEEKPKNARDALILGNRIRERENKRRARKGLPPLPLHQIPEEKLEDL
jgi:hypothetical protein